MAEYRGSIGSGSIVPAKDVQAASAGAIKKGDFVALDSAGKLVKGGATSSSLVGVSEGFNPQTDYEKTNGIETHKVRFSTDAVYETGIAGTLSPVVGTAYPIDASGNVKAAATGDVATVRVTRIKDGGKVDVTITAGTFE